jgi:putative nucleotidyltransferase with HDIG domain
MTTSKNDNPDRYDLLRKELRIGQKMPCHAFTRYGVLLLAQGEILATPTQLDRLSYPDVIFSNEPPPKLAAAIRERQVALGIIENSLLDTPLAEDKTASPAGKEFEDQSIDFEEGALVVPFVEEISIAREIYQDTSFYVVDLLAQVRAGKPIDLYETTNLLMRVMDSLDRNERALASLLRLKDMDTYTFTHSINTCVFSMMLARHVKQNVNPKALAIGALLHDVGKTFLPAELLSKEDRLTSSEWVLFRTHPEAGVDIIRQVEGYQEEFAEPILQHHEHLDGSGYPAQLRGEAISLMGRITAIADVYDSLTSDKPSGGPLSPPAAMRWISSQAGVLFDLELVRTFIGIVGIFPVASLARMNTGELALVVKVNPQAVLKPIILVISDANGTPLLKSQLINLAVPPYLNTKEIVGLEDAREFKIDVDECLASVSEQSIAEAEGLASTIIVTAGTYTGLDILA